MEEGSNGRTNYTSSGLKSGISSSLRSSKLDLVNTLAKGSITSPHHPIHYRPNENCQWTIKVIENIDIVATVDCRYGDYLIVSGKTGDTLKHITAFCGTKIPKPLLISASSEE